MASTMPAWRYPNQAAKKRGHFLSDGGTFVRKNPATGKDYTKGRKIGTKTWVPMHGGRDMRARQGDVFTPPLPGKVSRVGNFWGPSYGRQIEIRHRIKLSDGRIINRFSTFSHCSAILASPGDLVHSYDPVAKAGATGYVTGPHGHFTFQTGQSHKDGVIDATPYLLKAFKA